MQCMTQYDGQHRTLNQMLDALLKGGFWNVIWRLLVQSTHECLWVSSEGFGSDHLLCFSLEAEGGLAYSANLSGNEDVISLSDIVPETKICFVSSATANNNYTVLSATVALPLTSYLFLFCSEKKDKCLGRVKAFQEGVKQAGDLVLHLFMVFCRSQNEGWLLNVTWFPMKQWFIRWLY